MLNALDLEVVVGHRRSMFLEAGVASNVLDASIAPFRAWLAPRLADGRYTGWGIADGHDTVIASVGIIAIEWPPHPFHPTDDKRGYILNVFVEQAHRRSGLAKTLMLAAQQHARRVGLSFLTLHPTDAGRPLYDALGWRPMSEMYFRAGDVLV